ncbi:fimbrial protein [Pseudomonas sp. 18175]|uniref:fimbrial protein n=1 Tax=Pseudomonas sp. 18175 TaxID=3390056 RepID=UPI003D1C8D0C
MKLSVKCLLTLMFLGLPVAAHATCGRYQNDTFTLNLPATIAVPDSLPIGSVITRQAFNGTAPNWNTFCILATRWVNGRYPNNHNQGVHPTEVPGIGIAVRMTSHNGSSSLHTLHNIAPLTFSGPSSSFTSAEATFYKIGPVTTGTVPSGYFFEQKWTKSSSTFRLQLGSPVRFIRPAATCDLATGDVNRTITLPTIQARALHDAVSAGALNFELTATCTNASNVTFRFTGTPAIGNNALFANTGSAGGVALWLYSRAGGVALWLYSRTSGTPQTISHNGTRMVAVSGNRAVLPLGAAYYRNGVVGQGTLASTATVNITYN